MVVLKKHVLEDGGEWLDPIELLDECCPEKTEKIFMLAKACADVLNYFNENSSDAFGNAPYARKDGFLYGFLAGAGLELVQKETVWDIYKGKRIFLRVEVPKLRDSYYDEVKENKKTWLEVFG